MLVGLAIVARVVSSEASVLSEVDAARSALASARCFIDVFAEPSRSDAIRECGSDLGCMGRALPSEASLGLEVAVDARSDPALISLQLFDRAGADRAHALVEAEPDATSIGAAIERATATVLSQAGYVRGGRLVASSIPAGAVITVAGRPASRDALVLAPGRYEVIATLDGHDPATAIAEVTAGAELAVELRLEPEGSLVESPWLWVGVAGGVVAVTAVLVIALLPREEPSGPICQAADPSLCR